MAVARRPAADRCKMAFYELSQHPDILEEVRQEHIRVFGPDLDSVADEILRNPAILNDLPLTIAVIKETLRLWPPANAMRMADES